MVAPCIYVDYIAKSISFLSLHKNDIHNASFVTLTFHVLTQPLP